MRLNLLFIALIFYVSSIYSQIDSTSDISRKINQKTLNEESLKEGKKSNSKLFFSFGKNFTSYDYKNTQGRANNNVLNSDGFNFEIGKKGILALNLLTVKAFLSASLSLNEYNSIGSTSGTYLRWDTTYIGGNLFATIESFRFLSLISLEFSGGLGLSHILFGEQQIGSEVIRLDNHNEFDGLFIKPFVEIGSNLYKSNKTSIGLFLNLSKDFSLDTNSDQKLNFENIQVKFKIAVN